MTQPDPKDIFRHEAAEVLENLEVSLLDLGDALDDMELVNSVFRALHTLKGSGAMFGFTEVADFVHEFETAFDRVRSNEVAPTRALVRVALAAKDHIARLIAEPEIHGDHGEPLLERLRQTVGAPGAAAEPIVDAGAADAGWRVRFRLAEDALVLGANPVLMLDELRALGPCDVRVSLAGLPALEALDPAICHLAWDVAVRADCERGAIEDVFMFVRDGMELEIAPLAPPEASATIGDGPAPEMMATGLPPTDIPPERRERTGTAAAGGGSLRVPAERLDELLDRVGELVIAQARLSQIAGQSDDAALKNVSEEIERLATGLRDTTMGIRMVPIGSLFGRFRRLVHDLKGQLGKEMEFVTFGEETELDKTVVEKLADPLVHVIRNAIDHGIETPERRSAAGKPPVGRIRLSAEHQGAEVAISLVDDGAGLNTARIRAKAEEAGLIAPGSVLSDSEIHQFIFHPGFSTAQEISALSGRGVGMDVVKRTMEELRGRIEVTSTPGAGSRVTLRLPLTLAIIDGMLVRVGGNRYAIPLSAVEECVELPAEVAGGGKGRNFLNVRDALVPFLRLRELFRTSAPPELHQKLVIVSTGEQRVGLVVDQILGNTQTVIKSLSRLHSGIEEFSGATIMADGSVALILDVANLVRSGQRLDSRLREQQDGRAA
ncbi:chemotaxis protein CheA [Halovulum dunhuangense]|uniref:Chemotaxis protein CheA n=1 Tax=Halovulum dunhuangense TaxID=1505036 RepID=A0A849L1D5_9RHOB|nr:chemotaxis protein CheA [Halovulum dunhuangense]NNU80074.1 chemotaxis protein CheA [Halovulum dunhuangense]